ncbi:LysM peptidoglycan-binding domain-containing protein [Convivina praedatoris]|uniref:LysM domain-containing protein n=1 Tax=Convivina praedatoris TaxID=2880963 RepID=A0ABM9D238_9LACO|nr:LysM domain-containing protein [Convivina sp. LMG 32447]CAH1853629.1 hypothetical protein R077815_00893 [Convivina sp. LMG 32447]CAH1854729.1 hypothetical protein R078138_00973 [Convivina sp. LMG 32447]CAH1855085.1 hypothetical protein LMG032447_01007 [Convivina sp. LMG 32447]
MNENQQPMSRSLRNKAEHKQAAKQDAHQNKGHARLIVFLVMVSLVVLSSAPIYGLISNHPSPSASKSSSSKKESSASKSESTSSSSSSKSSTSSQSSSQPTSASEHSSSAMSESAQSSSQQPSQSSSSSQAATGNTAVLAPSQTLYNFAVSHGTTTQQVISLNPGLNANNYSQYAGQALRVK